MAGGFLTTGPPGKSWPACLWVWSFLSSDTRQIPVITTMTRNRPRPSPWKCPGAATFSFLLPHLNSWQKDLSAFTTFCPLQFSNSLCILNIRPFSYLWFTNIFPLITNSFPFHYRRHEWWNLLFLPTLRAQCCVPSKCSWDSSETKMNSAVCHSVLSASPQIYISAEIHEPSAQRSLRTREFIGVWTCDLIRELQSPTNLARLVSQLQGRR